MAAHPSTAGPPALGWALALLVALGAAGFVVARERDDPAGRHALALGDGWRATDSRGRVLQVPRAAGGGLTLHDGERRLEFPSSAGGWSAWELQAVRLAEPVELELRFDGAAGSWTLGVVPDEPYALSWRTRDAGGRTRTVAEHRADPTVLSAFAPFRVGVRRDGATLVASLQGEDVLRLPADVAGGLVPGLVVRGGPLRLLSMRLDALRPASTAGATTLLDETFVDLPPAPRLPRVLASLAWAAALVVLVSACLAALAPDGTPSPAVGGAVLTALALPALVLAVELATAVPQRWALACLALLTGIVVARPRARAAEAARGAGPARTPADRTDAARADAARAHSARAARAARGRVAVGILAVLLAAGELGRQQLDRLRPLLDAERRAADVAVATDVQRTAAADLDAAGALTLRGPFRDVRLAARVRLAPDALLEVRLRAPDPRYAHGLALFVPAPGAGRATDGARWMWEDVAVFEPLGPEGAHVPADTWLDLRVEARGRDLVAWWEQDGVRHELARGRTLQHPVGDVVLLAAAGRAGVADLVVEPVDGPGSAAGALAGAAAGAVPWADVAASVAPLLLLVVLWLAVAAVVLGVAPSRALQAAGLALLPLAVVLRWQDEAAAPSPGLVAAAAVAAGAWLLVHGCVHTTRAGRGHRLACGLAAPVACCLAFGAAVERPFPRDPAEANFLGWTAGGGTRVDWGRPHLEHAYVRRWNHYLAEHRLRGRRVALDKPEGTRRVVCLGGSSTVGYRLPVASDLDYPSRLQERLGRAAAWSVAGAPPAVAPLAGAPPAVEVLNAAVLATTLARQFVFLRDVLLELQPDVVVASFFYNDAFALSRDDELDRLLAPGAHREGPVPWRRPWRLPWPLGPLLSAETRENLAGHRRLRRLMGDFARGGTPSLDAWPADAGRPPPESFEAALTALAGLCARHGVDLILVPEPLAGDKAFLWKAEFRAAMERVAARHGLPVVDPTPALQAAGGGTLFMDQVHLAPAGHEVVAAVLEPHVVALLRRRP